MLEPQPELTHPSARQREPSRWWLALILVCYVGVRCLYAPLMELSGDEAYYWTWSRHLAGGYLDHAPMVAWAIRLGTALLGNTELGVRLPAALMSAGTIAAVLWAATQVIRSGVANPPAASARPNPAGPPFRQLLSIELLMLAFPLTHVTGAIITPDTPAALFTMLAVAAALGCLRKPGNVLCYVLLGIFCGLAMLSKYTTLVPVTTILIFLALRDRRQFGRVILAGILATIVLSPMLLWNYQHDWISFRFQLRHGTGMDEHAAVTTVSRVLAGAVGFVTYIASQLLIGTPVLMPLMVVCAVAVLRHKSDPALRLLAVAGLAPLALFACTSVLHKVEANWTSQAYLPLLVLLALQLPSGAAWLRKTYTVGLRIAVVFVIVLHIPPAVLARLAPGTPLARIGGYRSLAANVHRLAGPLQIVATRYQDASLLSFYLPGQPRITILREPRDRITQDTVDPGPRPRGEFLLVTDGGIYVGSTAPFVYVREPFNAKVLSLDETSGAPDCPSLKRYAFHAVPAE